MIKSLVISSLILNLGVFLGRLSGFFREAIIAANYGSSADADTIIVMLTVPDFLVSILMGGAFGAAFIPEFTQNSKNARTVLYQAAIIFGLLFLFLSILIYFNVGSLVSVLMPGFESLQFDAAVAGVAGVIWLVPLTVLSGITAAYLQSQNKFALPSLGTLIINAFIIIGLLFISSGHESIYVLAVFVVLGGVVRLLSQCCVIRLSWRPIKSLFPFKIKKQLFIQYLQAMASGSLLLLFPVVARAIASYESEGSVSLFNYASKLVEFPLVISVTFLSVIFFPRLSKSFNSDKNLHSQLICYGLRVTLSFALVAAIALIVLSHSYSSLVYGYGEMSESDVSDVAHLVGIGLFMLPLQGVAVFLTSVFNSRKNTLTPMLVNAVGLLLFLIISYFSPLGGGLDVIMINMVFSYAFICVSQLLLSDVEVKVVFNRAFILPLIISSSSLVFLCRWVQSFDMSNFLSFFLVFLCSVFALLAVAVFDVKFRTLIIAKIVS